VLQHPPSPATLSPLRWSPPYSASSFYPAQIRQEKTLNERERERERNPPSGYFTSDKITDNAKSPKPFPASSSGIQCNTLVHNHFATFFYVEQMMIHREWIRVFSLTLYKEGKTMQPTMELPSWIYELRYASAWKQRPEFCHSPHSWRTPLLLPLQRFPVSSFLRLPHTHHTPILAFKDDTARNSSLYQRETNLGFGARVHRTTKLVKVGNILRTIWNNTLGTPPRARTCSRKLEV
jgi:hypothetical protein